MSDDRSLEERIEKLEALVADLREQCQKSDEGLALLVGIVCGATGVRMTVGIDAILTAAQQSGWQGSVLERFTEGSQMVTGAMKHGRM